MYVITRAEAGGAQVHLLHLLHHVVNIATVTLVTGEEGFLTERARALGVTVHVLPSLVRDLHPARDAVATLALSRMIRAQRPDLVHLHSSKAGVVGRVAARLAGTPTVFTAHGWGFTENAPTRQRQLARHTERLLAPLTRQVIAVSDYDFELAVRERVTRPPRMHRIHNGIPDSPFLAQHAPRLRVQCVMTARHAPPKEQRALIRAVVQAPEVDLLLIGDGPELDSARELARSLNVEERVTFAGNRTDVPELLATCDLFALVSQYEGFPLSILEAMRAGLPVIATDVGGVREAVTDGVTGRLVPRGDHDALVAALRDLTADAQARARMGAAGRARYLAEFTTGHMIQRTLGVYTTALAPRATGTYTARG